MNMGLSMLRGQERAHRGCRGHHVPLPALRCVRRVLQGLSEMTSTSGEVLQELRAYCVEQGQLVPEHMAMIDCLKQEDNVFGEPKAERGDWAEGLGLKDINTEKADVLFHAGCRYSYDKDLWGVTRGAVTLMRIAGADMGIAGKEESCCGGRAYELGFRGDAENYADDMLSRIKASGASTLVTCCSDGYATTCKYLYPKMGKSRAGGGPSRHRVPEPPDRRRSTPPQKQGRSPCHLSRSLSPGTDGRAVPRGVGGRQASAPMSMKRTGRKGCYEPPAEVLRSIPGWSSWRWSEQGVRVVLRRRRRRA